MLSHFKVILRRQLDYNRVINEDKHMSITTERYPAPGDTNDSQPHPNGELPAVVPDWSILEEPKPKPAIPEDVVIVSD
jgi:hypothetical protein